MHIDFRFFLNVFLRRLPLFIIVVALFTSIGVSVALLLPPEYRAGATLLVEREQIPESLAASTVQTAAPEQLRIIEQRLLSRETLLDIAQQLELFTDPETGQRAIPAGAIVSEMRSRTSFRLRNAGGGRGNPGTVILEVGYSSESARETAEVVNELVTRILEQNVELRTAQASETLEFFEQEVERLNTELDAQSAQLLEFQSEAGVAIPENMDFLRSRLAVLQDRRAQGETQIERVTEQRQRLIDLFERTGRVTPPEESRSPLEAQLAAARRELLDAQVIFSPQNPKLRVLQTRVERLEERMALVEDAQSLEQSTFASNPTSQAQVLFETQLAELDQQLEDLTEVRANIDEEIEAISSQIAEATQNGFAIAKLQRDLNGIRADYERARNRLSAAQTGERIELLAKGQRISVIEQAIVPASPDSPNRPLIAAAGMAGGFAVALGLIVLLELLNRSVRRPVELTSRLGITPIGVVPYIRTDREVALKRTVVIGVAVLILVGLPTLLLLVHALVFPFDRAVEPVLNRVGFSIGG